jgi:hypothetical protein
VIHVKQTNNLEVFFPLRYKLSCLLLITWCSDQAAGLKTHGSSLYKAGDVSLLQTIQTGSETPQTSVSSSSSFLWAPGS